MTDKQIDNHYDNIEYFECGCVVAFNKDRSEGKQLKVCEDDREDDKI